MDPDVCKTITRSIGKLSTTGKMAVDPKGVKDLIHYAGKSEEYLKFTHEKLLMQLKKKHAEIRFGVFLIIEEFFKKSAFYRELLLDEFRTILDLTVGPDSTSPLPPPEEAAELLKSRTLKAFQKWQDKFSKTHPRLPVAYNYIKSVLKIDFSDQLHRSAEEVNATREQREINERTKFSQLEILRQDIREHRDEISNLILEIRNSFNLLLPKPEEFLGSTEMVDCEKTEDHVDIDLREHGFTGPTSIIIELAKAKAEIAVTEDNDILVETLKGLYRRAKNRYCPLVNQWARMAKKLGGFEEQEETKKLSEELESEISKFDDLNLIPLTSKSSLAEDLDCSDSFDDSDNDDEDFEDVPDKDGYEEFAVAPPVVPKTVKTSAGTSASSSSTATSWNIVPPLKNEELHDPTYGLQPPVMHQFVSASSSMVLKRSRASELKSDDRKSKLLAVAPKLPFDIDLYHWEDTELKAPAVEVADTGLHRFWQPLDREGDTIENPDGVTVLRTRTIEFSGKFEPIHRSCRAPLPSGALCPRMDRQKVRTCPFHGKIIPRDEQGNPTEDEDKIRLQEERVKAEKTKPPDWQDPKHLKELHDQIGIDLTIRPAKRGGKSFAEKYPQLTDIRKLKDDPRKRLEKKIFNKKSLKRVAKSMDEANAKRFRDKFGDQFNYGG